MGFQGFYLFGLNRGSWAQRVLGLGIKAFIFQGLGVQRLGFRGGGRLARAFFRTVRFRVSGFRGLGCLEFILGLLGFKGIGFRVQGFQV